MFGVEPSTRGAVIEARIGVLRQAFAGERFAWEGRPIDVRPQPYTDGGPMLMYGGGSLAAARRAARLGMMLLPQTSDPALAEAYDAEAESSGTTPGMTMSPPDGAPTSVFIAEDVEQAWADMGPYLLHDAQMYAEWMGPDSNASSFSTAATVDDLRSGNGAYRIVTPADAIDLIGQFGALSMQPLCGGMPPDLAWASLRLLESKVLPMIG